MKLARQVAVGLDQAVDVIVRETARPQVDVAVVEARLAVSAWKSIGVMVRTMFATARDRGPHRGGYLHAVDQFAVFIKEEQVRIESLLKEAGLIK